MIYVRLSEANYNVSCVFEFLRLMFETSKHVPKTEKRCCVFKDNSFMCQQDHLEFILHLYLVPSSVSLIFRNLFPPLVTALW